MVLSRGTLKVTYEITSLYLHFFFAFSIQQFCMKLRSLRPNSVVTRIRITGALHVLKKFKYKYFFHSLKKYMKTLCE